ncbi:hypothetical protein RDV64_17555 [Acuticoccus sp. MNP-M23]|uniref:response regulator n=1 Tax=Acuticoccus sp. MNP-M23 TaxID=3072793 RepID=UPI002814E61F|nr:response regulator [Acuticoccus sp. MNP-M23]WMS41856.1 hypothetical protein RDV64_17555 [Acuticoccus sp. MNP-M23]
MSLRIMVVEDEVLVGMDLVMLLEDWGYCPDGPHASVREAIDAFDNFEPQVAILDMNLGGGESSIPIAEELVARGIPFVFLTGYTRLNLSGDPLTKNVPTMKKPISEDDLRSTLRKLSEQVSVD